MESALLAERSRNVWKEEKIARGELHNLRGERDQDLTGPWVRPHLQLRSPAEGHKKGMGIGLKRALAVALIVVFLCSVSVASAAGSLLPFDHEWIS